LRSIIVLIPYYLDPPGELADYPDVRWPSYQIKAGGHDAATADINGNGEMVIVSKVWNADGPSYHLDFWRNELVR